MPKDFVIPHNNEKQFIDMALKLGYTDLVFVYKDIPKKLIEHKDINLSYATLLQKQPKKTKGLLLLSNNPEQARLAAEHPAVDGLFGLEKDQQDFIHHRGSGMNHIIAKILAKKKKFYLIDFRMLLEAQPNKRAQLIGRVKQNLKLCKKYKVRHGIVSCARHPFEMRSKQDLHAVLRVLEKN